MDVWPQHEKHLVGLVVRGAGRIAGRVATLNGSRKTLDWLQDEFFVAMTDEVDRAGAPNRVAAGMFGTTHRTFLRRTAAAREGLGTVGSSLWWQIRETVAKRPLTRQEIVARYARHPPDLMASILRDMTRNGWLVKVADSYSAAADGAEWSEERLRNYVESRALTHGLPSLEQLVEETGLPEARLEAALSALPKLIDRPQVLTDFLLWRFLALFAESALFVLYSRVGGEAVAGVVHTLTFTNDRTAVDRLHSLFERTSRAFSEGYVEAVEGQLDGTAEEHLYTCSMTETIVPSNGWIDSPS